MLLRNPLYAGIVDVPEYGVRGKRGDFEPLISEDLFYQAQVVLSGRIPSTAPRKRAHPDFPLRGFVRCESCGRGLTGSWSKGRSEYYAYYHCRPGCRAVNVSKAKLEGLFADELALLQPTPGYMRLLKESVLQIWKAHKAAVRKELDRAERGAKAIQDKLDRLDEAFLFERSIDIETYDRHAEKLREELTLARIYRHSGQLEELDVEGILAFPERILPRAADLWVQASLEQRQRFQQLFFPDGIAFGGKRLVRTGATAPAFNYLREIRTGKEGLACQP
jgi:hypothetical protein